MRNNDKRTPILLALASMLASLITFVSPGTAAAAETIPELMWPAVAANSHEYGQMTTSPQGEVTIGCNPLDYNAQDLTTYSASGAVVRQISRTSQIDGVNNCIRQPAVDKNGMLYGSPSGGANLLAYQGNTLKWKYPTGCTGDGSPAKPVIGANGNIYFINGLQHLIGITPNVAAGQTQPTKVLDIAVTGGCSSGLRAYRDGLAIMRTGNLTYYGYSGVNLGSPPGNYWQDSSYPMDADGRMFYPTIVSGTVKSLNISVYNPGNKKVLWTKQASTPSANVLSHAVSTPLPSGGAVVAFRQQKMISDSVPATPTEYIYALTSFSPSGQKLWTKQLPATDGEGYVSSIPSMSADVNGNVVVARRWTKPNTSGTVELATVDVINGVTGDTVSSPKILKGNSNTADGAVYGYTMEQMSTTATIGPGGVYITAYRCAPSLCEFNSRKLYPFKVAGLGMDYPRGAVFSRTPRPTAPYVALGDSFSSGEGVTPFAASTNIPAVNECHRSDFAYARLISGTSTKIPSLGSNGFRACSGAVTENITDAAQWNEGTQTDLWPDSTTKLVTLTIGGNDIKFSDFGRACFFGTCDVGSAAYNTSLNEIDNVLPGKLEVAYKRILKYAPNAKVYVLGYPQVVANKSTTAGDDIRCQYMKDGNTNWGDARAARGIVSKLNVKIKTKVDAIRGLGGTNLRLNYVPLDGANSLFSSHEACSTGTSWFHNVNQAAIDDSYAFHPNKLGQEGYATIAKNAINAG